MLKAITSYLSTSINWFVIIFVLPLFFIFFQSIIVGQTLKTVKINGIVRDESSKAPIEGVRVSILHDHVETINSDHKGRYSFTINKTYIDSLYILFYDPSYITKILGLNAKDYRDEIINLEPKYLPEYEQKINATVHSSLSTPNNTMSIESVEVFANEGIRRGKSNSEGKFDIIISMNNNPSFTYLWLEKKGYETEVAKVSNFNEEVQIPLEPLKRTFHFDFTVLRSDTKSGVENVDILLENNLFGVTEKSGKLSAEYNLDYDINKVAVNVRHKWFKEQSFIAPLNNQMPPIKIELEPLPQKIKVRPFYHSTRISMENVDNPSFNINGKTVSGVLDNNGTSIDLTLRAIPGDTLRITLPSNMRYVPLEGFIILKEGKDEYNYQVERIPVDITIITKNQKNNIILDAGVVEFQCKNYTKIVSGNNGNYALQSNWFNPGDTIRANIHSERYTQTRPLSIVINENAITYSEFLILSEAENAGTLTINSDPDNAQVYIDGILQSKLTPVTLKLIEGIYNIKIIKEGFFEHEQQVEMVPHRLMELGIILKRRAIEPPKHFRMSTDISLLTWNFTYPDIIIIPAPKIGGQFFYYPSKNLGFRFSFFGSKFPTYYVNQEIGFGALFEKAKWGAFYCGIKDNYFESTKGLLVKFEGISGELNFQWYKGSTKFDNSLPYLKNHHHAWQIGFEGSFKTMNKILEGTIEPKPKAERYFYIGYKIRYQKSILDFQLGFFSPKIKMIDKDNGQVKQLRIIRANFGYSYFWN